MKRWTDEDLRDALLRLTQVSIDRAVCYTQHPGLRDAWASQSGYWAWVLLREDDPTGKRQSAARAVVSFAFHGSEPAEFWRSDLGQLLYLADGFPPRNPTKTEAASILGVSHQAVSDLIRRGGLIENEGKVDAASLRGRWLRRARRWEEE